MECLFKDSCNFFIVITSILDFRIINNNGLSMCVFKVYNGHNIVFFSFTFLVCFNCTVYNVYSFFVVITRQISGFEPKSTRILIFDSVNFTKRVYLISDSLAKTNVVLLCYFIIKKTSGLQTAMKRNGDMQLIHQMFSPICFPILSTKFSHFEQLKKNHSKYLLQKIVIRVQF